MKSSSIELVPENLLASHKRKLYAEDKITPEELDLVEKIKEKVLENNISLISHYYTDTKIQKITEELNGCVSDSLQMAKFGKESKSNTLVVSGVKFMGETAKILSPEKKVYMPTLEATCSLDLGCPANEFKKFCEDFPDREIVVYANTSAEVKAILRSPLNKDFTNLKFPFSEFPNGVEITFYDTEKNETLVSSNYAIIYNKTNIVDMVGNVEIKLSDGSVLKTSQLYWDPEQEWLFSENNFTFKSSDYDIKANRLDANRQFTIFNTGLLDGNLTVEENEN